MPCASEDRACLQTVQRRPSCTSCSNRPLEYSPAGASQASKESRARPVCWRCASCLPYTRWYLKYRALSPLLQRSYAPVCDCMLLLWLAWLCLRVTPTRSSVTHICVGAANFRESLVLDLGCLPGCLSVCLTCQASARGLQAGAVLRQL